MTHWDPEGLPIDPPGTLKACPLTPWDHESESRINSWTCLGQFVLVYFNLGIGIHVDVNVDVSVHFNVNLDADIDVDVDIEMKVADLCVQLLLKV